MAAASFAALVALTGCSDDKKDAASPTTTASAAPLTTVRPVDTSFTGVGSAEFCAFIPSLLDASQSVPASATPAQIKAGLETSLTAFDEAVAVAPPDIKDAVVTISDAVRSVASALETANYDVTKIDPAAAQRLLEDRFSDASVRLKAYLDKYCTTPAGG
ncbi:MAG: hypothetical protein QOH36_78 [Actinomycetota bacterium]|nr:hypothetical protein [Actinomycetota bacterium]